MPPRGALSLTRSLQACWPGCLVVIFSHLIWTAKEGRFLCPDTQQLRWALRTMLGVLLMKESPLCQLAHPTAEPELSASLLTMRSSMVQVFHGSRSRGFSICDGLLKGAVTYAGKAATIHP